MSTCADHFRRQITGRKAGSISFLAALRWSLVVLLLCFGGMKFTAYEGAIVAPSIVNSPFLTWLRTLFGLHGANYVIGVLDLVIAAALILGAFNPVFSRLAAAIFTATYAITLTLFLTSPGVAETMSVGFSALQNTIWPVFS